MSKKIHPRLFTSLLTSLDVSVRRKFLFDHYDKINFVVFNLKKQLEKFAESNISEIEANKIILSVIIDYKTQMTIEWLGLIELVELSDIMFFSQHITTENIGTFLELLESDQDKVALLQQITTIGDFSIIEYFTQFDSKLQATVILCERLEKFDIVTVLKLFDDENSRLQVWKNIFKLENAVMLDIGDVVDLFSNRVDRRCVKNDWASHIDPNYSESEDEDSDLDKSFCVSRGDIYTDDDDQQCAICFYRRKCVVTSCGHMVTCSHCTRKLISQQNVKNKKYFECVICRNQCQYLTKVFL